MNHTFELIFFIYMIPFAWSYMMSSVHSGQLSPACGIPMYYIQAAPLVSFVLVAFRVLQRWIIEFRVARGENVFDPAHPERNTPCPSSRQMPAITPLKMPSERRYRQPYPYHQKFK